MNNCKNCNSDLQGNCCSNCGQPAKLKRIDGQYLRYELGQVLQFEKGIFFIIKELVIRPGNSIRTFIAEDRMKAFAAYFLGAISFAFTAILLGLLIDFIF